MKLDTFSSRQAKNLSNNINENHKNKTYYRLIDDVGYTFGSLVNDFRIWLVNDLKSFCDVKYTYITNNFNGMESNTMWFTEGMLLSVPKPNLSLTFTIDHTFENNSMNHPSVNNFEAINFLKPGQFMDHIIQAVEGKGKNIQVSLAFKSVRININSGIIAQSRYYADNFTHTWGTKRKDNSIYATKWVADFQIPNYVIELLYEKFNIKRDGYRAMLRWLNRHSKYPVWYGLNTYNGKPYFFIKYRLRPTIRPNGLSNPQAIGEGGQGQINEMWVLTRQFEVDVMVPSIIGINGYTTPIVSYDNTKSLDDGISEFLKDEHLQEFTLQIRDKHAVADLESEITEEDITKTNSGKPITKKIDLSPIFENYEDLQEFVKWGEGLGLCKHQMFDFTISKNYLTGNSNTYMTLGKGHTLSDAINKLGVTVEEFKEYVDENKLLLKSDDNRLLTVDDIAIPNEEMEYDHYIKNSKDFWFVDLDPKVGDKFKVTFYASIRLWNQFVIETNYGFKDHISSDDYAHVFPQGRDKNFNNPQDRY